MCASCLGVKGLAQREGLVERENGCLLTLAPPVQRLDSDCSCVTLPLSLLFPLFMPLSHHVLVHGGATAALFDNCFGVAFFAAQVGNGFTANLNVNYRYDVSYPLIHMNGWRDA